MKRHTRHARDYYRSLRRYRRRGGPFTAVLRALRHLGRTRSEAQEEAAALFSWERAS